MRGIAVDCERTVPVAVFSPRAAARALCGGRATERDCSGREVNADARVGVPHTATCGWEKGEYMALSNHDHGKLSRRLIDEGLPRQPLVHCGFDNDIGGNKLWAQVKEAPRAPRPSCARPPRPGRRTGTTPCALGWDMRRGKKQEDARAPSRSRNRAQGHEDHSH